jgi:hypothetical protein
MVFALMCAFCVSINATDDEVSVPTEEITTEEEIELPESATEEDIKGVFEGFKETFSELWVWLVAIFGTSSVTVVGIVLKWGINKIAENAKKTDTKIDDKLLEHQDKIMLTIDGVVNSFNEVRERLNASTETMDKMMAVLSVTIMNMNLSQSAKTELVEMLTGIKKYSGELIEIVNKAQESIDTAKAEKLSLSEPTPTLDKLMVEENKNNYMDLG